MVPQTVRILPLGRKWGRPGYKLRGERTITMHNTANEQQGADAETHARFLESGRGISWHYTVDHDSIIQHIPLDEQAWHTGTNAGNTTSIGIEVCEYDMSNPREAWKGAVAEKNGAELAARLCREMNLDPATDVVTHMSWSGKICPRDILPHWSAFLAVVKRFYGGEEVDDVVNDCAFIIVPGSAANLEAAKVNANKRGLWAQEVTKGFLWIHARQDKGTAKPAEEMLKWLKGRGFKNITTMPTYVGSQLEIQTFVVTE